MPTSRALTPGAAFRMPFSCSSDAEGRRSNARSSDVAVAALMRASGGVGALAARAAARRARLDAKRHRERGRPEAEARRRARNGEWGLGVGGGGTTAPRAYDEIIETKVV